MSLTSCSSKPFHGFRKHWNCVLAGYLTEYITAESKALLILKSIVIDIALWKIIWNNSMVASLMTILGLLFSAVAPTTPHFGYAQYVCVR